MIAKTRMDGTIFNKQVYPIKKKKIFGEPELNTNVIIMNAFQDALKKIKNK